MPQPRRDFLKTWRIFRILKISIWINLALLESYHFFFPLSCSILTKWIPFRRGMGGKLEFYHYIRLWKTCPLFLMCVYYPSKIQDLCQKRSFLYWSWVILGQFAICCVWEKDRYVWGGVVYCDPIKTDKTRGKGKT